MLDSSNSPADKLAKRFANKSLTATTKEPQYQRLAQNYWYKCRDETLAKSQVLPIHT
jgi:hypothetical protein